MAKQSVVGLAGMVLAGAVLAGCQNCGGGCWRNRDKSIDGGGTAVSQNQNWNNRANNLTGNAPTNPGLVDNRQTPANPMWPDAQPAGASRTDTTPSVRTQPGSLTGSGPDPGRSSAPIIATSGGGVSPSGYPATPENIITPPPAPQDIHTRAGPTNPADMIIPPSSTRTEDTTSSTVPASRMETTAKSIPDDSIVAVSQGPETRLVSARADTPLNNRESVIAERSPFEAGPAPRSTVTRGSTYSDPLPSVPAASAASTPGSGMEIPRSSAVREDLAIPDKRETTTHVTDDVVPMRE